MRYQAGGQMETPKYNRVPVGKVLQQARKAAGLTQEKAAEAVGCSLRHIIQIEGGATGLSIDLLLSLCVLYHITPNDVLCVLMPNEPVTRGEAFIISSYRALSDEEKRIAQVLLTALAKDTRDSENP